jgi:hypothetical protein
MMSAQRSNNAIYPHLENHQNDRNLQNRDAQRVIMMPSSQSAMSGPNSANLLKNRLIQALIDFIVIIIIFLIFGAVFLFVKPKINYMTCDQSEIFMPYKTDTIPFWAVGIYATLGPILFIIGVEFINSRFLPCQANYGSNSQKEKLNRFVICVFHGLSLFALGISITLLLTEIGSLIFNL